MNLNKFFESLASNNSRNFKIDQLNANSDNEVLRKVVRLALDPFTQFYIRKIPDYTPNKGDGISLKFALDSIGDLSKRLVTGNAGIDHLRANLEALNEQDAKVLERVIQKDLKCGVDVSTANKVWKNLIAEYPVMLCSPFEQKLIDKIQFPAFVQTKMDGMRFNAIVTNGKCEFRSRNGKEINLLGNLEEDFIAMANGVNCVFDGELLVKDKGIVLDRQTGNGILNKANKGTIKTDEARKVHATIWDLIPYDEFTLGVCKVPYSQRLESLCVMMDTYKPKKVALVDRWEVASYDEARTLFEGLLADGQEGIILKCRNGIWEDKRSKTQIKFKGELECDLKIVAVEEGKGKAAGMLGAIICESSDGVVKVNVGSGFTEEHRKKYWAENLVDRIVAIKYNSRITNKQGEDSLFLPVFIELRDDKDVADHSKVIK
jgi:ATP dependent DNA ligase domain/DNA ligase OB-like domain